MAGAGRWFLAADFGLTPNEAGRVQYVQIVEPRIAVVASVKIDLVSVNRRCVVVSTCRSWTESFRFIVGVVDIAHIWWLGHRRGVVDGRAKEKAN